MTSQTLIQSHEPLLTTPALNIHQAHIYQPPHDSHLLIHSNMNLVLYSIVVVMTLTTYATSIIFFSDFYFYFLPSPLSTLHWQLISRLCFACPSCRSSFAHSGLELEFSLVRLFYGSSRQRPVVCWFWFGGMMVFCLQEAAAAAGCGGLLV